MARKENNLLYVRLKAINVVLILSILEFSQTIEKEFSQTIEKKCILYWFLAYVLCIAFCATLEECMKEMAPYASGLFLKIEVAYTFPIAES